MATVVHKIVGSRALMCAPDLIANHRSLRCNLVHFYAYIHHSMFRFVNAVPSRSRGKHIWLIDSIRFSTLTCSCIYGRNSLFGEPCSTGILRLSIWESGDGMMSLWICNPANASSQIIRKSSNRFADSIGGQFPCQIFSYFNDQSTICRITNAHYYVADDFPAATITPSTSNGQLGTDD